MPVTFVYRSHYSGPLSKRVMVFPEDDSVLGWFQRVWPGVKKAKDPSAAVGELLGDSVYGFSSLFEAARDKDLPAPRSLKGLRALLEEYLYVEGEIELDAHSLRALTDDDEVNLAYFFFDDKAAEPSRVAYLLHKDFPLPTGAASWAGRFKSPVEARPLGPTGHGKGRTWAIFLTFYDSDSFPSDPPSVIEGVRLPELARHLREVVPEAKSKSKKDPYPETWPLELRLLRAAVGPDDVDLGPALRRCNGYPLWVVGAESGTGTAGLGPQAGAWADFEKLAKGKKHSGDPGRSLIDASGHIAQAAMHASQAFGYQQWFLFDDLWAAANPDMAASLLRYAAGWDPWDDDAEGPDSSG